MIIPFGKWPIQGRCTGESVYAPVDTRSTITCIIGNWCSSTQDTNHRFVIVRLSLFISVAVNVCVSPLLFLFLLLHTLLYTKIYIYKYSIHFSVIKHINVAYLKSPVVLFVKFIVVVVVFGFLDFCEIDWKINGQCNYTFLSKARWTV